MQQQGHSGPPQHAPRSDHPSLSELHIVGASGAAGSFLIERLRAAGTAAIAHTRQPFRSAQAGDVIVWRSLDLWRDQRACSATALISLGPLDALVHWLARVDTPHLQRLVALGSTSIDSKRDAPDAGERAIAQRLQQSEARLRQLCDQRDIAWTILRPTLIWGAGLDVSLTPLYRLGLRGGWAPVPWSDGGLRQPVHAEDVAAACVLAMQCDQACGLTMSLGGGEQLPAAMMWSRVIVAAQARVLRMPRSLLMAGSYLSPTHGTSLRSALQRWPSAQIVDDEVARSVLDWNPRGFAPAPSDFRLKAPMQ